MAPSLPLLPPLDCKPNSRTPLQAPWSGFPFGEHLNPTPYQESRYRAFLLPWAASPRCGSPIPQRQQKRQSRPKAALLHPYLPSQDTLATRRRLEHPGNRGFGVRTRGHRITNANRPRYRGIAFLVPSSSLRAGFTSFCSSSRRKRVLFHVCVPFQNTVDNDGNPHMGCGIKKTRGLNRT